MNKEIAPKELRRKERSMGGFGKPEGDASDIRGDINTQMS